MTSGPASDPSSAGPPLHPTYRLDVDGLRALAIVPVVAFHAFPAIAPGGFVGVDVFFVISGYLISSIIFGGLERGRFSLREFYVRRIKRIFPALVLVLLTCLIWGWLALFSDDYALLGKHIAGGAGFIANFLYWNEAGYFDVASDTKPLLHLWSLGIEEQFYLVWPSLVLLCWRGRAPLVLVIAVLFAVSFGINVVQVRSDEVAAFYAPWTRLWELLMGSALALLARTRMLGERFAWLQRLTNLSASPTVQNAASLAGLAGVLSAMAFFNSETSYPGWRAALPTGGTLLVLAAGPDAWLNKQVLSRKALVWIGLISYPLYLWHWPMLAFARIAEAGEPSVARRLAIVSGSVLLAWATYAVVERRVRFGATRRAVVPALCALTLVAGVGGYITFAQSGFADRPINQSDQAHFLQYYARLRTNGTLKAAYRWECDFLDWDTEKNRDAIDPSCTQAGPNGTVFLWGDSHGQALSAGIRAVLPTGIQLAQVTTSGCAPRLREANPEALSGRCQRSNTYALERISAITPDTLLLAQILAHTDTDWEALAAGLRARGVRDVVLVGPAPQWQPSLPLVVTRDRWTTGFDRVNEGLSAEILDLDRALQARLGASTAIRYVSLIGRLCDEQGCLATVPGSDRQLMTVDSGHFSPDGSMYVADAILRPYLPSR